MFTAQHARYVIRRVLQAIPTILLIISLNFFLLHLAPGNAASVLAGESGSATPEYMTYLEQEFGLNKPLYVQYLNYIKNTATLNLGYSFRDGMPVRDLILQRLGPTLLLMGTTIVISVGLGLLLGLFAGRRPNSVLDNFISVFALISYATPLFWIGLMFIVLFSIDLGWLPTSGMTTIAGFYTGWEAVWDVIRHLILPATTLSLFYMALYVRLMRSSTLEQNTMDYVVTARSKGLTESNITFRHILRNACLPVVTMAGIQIGNLLGGSVVVETVFGWPGIGLLAFKALFARNLNLLLGIFFIAAILVIVVNIVVDLIYSFLDPRIQVR
jgi:peptide/nickel transport system permease protein